MDDEGMDWMIGNMQEGTVACPLLQNHPFWAWMRTDACLSRSRIVIRHLVWVDGQIHVQNPRVKLNISEMRVTIWVWMKTLHFLLDGWMWGGNNEFG